MELGDAVVLVELVELVVLDVVAVTLFVGVLLPEGEGRSGEETDEADVDWAIDCSKGSC